MLKKGCVITDNMDNVYHVKEYKLHRPAKEGPANDKYFINGQEFINGRRV